MGKTHGLGDDLLDFLADDPPSYAPGPSIITGSLVPHLASRSSEHELTLEARLIGPDPDVAAAYRALGEALARQHAALGGRVTARTVTITVTATLDWR
jgi:hypothetical protein